MEENKIVPNLDFEIKQLIEQIESGNFPERKMSFWEKFKRFMDMGIVDEMILDLEELSKKGYFSKETLRKIKSLTDEHLILVYDEIMKIVEDDSQLDLKGFYLFLAIIVLSFIVTLVLAKLLKIPLI